MRNYFGIPYSFVCGNLKCTRQFEQNLSELITVDTVSCPHCGTAIDLKESKQTGDLSRVFRDVHAFEKSRS